MTTIGIGYSAAGQRIYAAGNLLVDRKKADEAAERQRNEDATRLFREASVQYEQERRRRLLSDAADLALRNARPKTLAQIISQVAEKHQLSPHELTGPRRTRKVMAARLEYYWRSRKETSRSTTQIGKFCGGRDHTTVMSGWRRYETLLARANQNAGAAE